MPPKSTQETGHPSSPPQPSKLAPKSQAAGAQPPTKHNNGKKNGKGGQEAGGVLAAVTKNVGKIPNNKQAVTIPSRFPPPSPPLPEIMLEPSSSSASKENPVTSPLLDTLVSSKYTSQSITNEWAKNVPAYSSSPSNLINLGESPPALLPSSPPILPSSYEDRLANFGWKTKEQRGNSSGHPSSASPPSNRRPMSYHIESNNSPAPESTYASRRSSMYSPPQYSRMVPSNPPLPHQLQNHFYGAPQIDIMPPSPGLIAGENGFHCGFDSLPLSSQDSSKIMDNVVVTGYEGGLDIYAVSRRGLERCARIDGLRGGIYNAKILISHTGSPAIAVVVHGPVRIPSDLSNGDYATTPPSDGMYTAQNGSIRGSPRIRPPSVIENDMTEYYQTTVEIYSLSDRRYLTTLLTLPEIPLTVPTTSPSFRAPLPTGALTIRADAGNVIVSSGVTGETWIFREDIVANPAPRSFSCIGKVWTTVQQGLTAETSSLNGHVDGDWHSTEPPPIRQQYKAPILSLNGRWLAYCPSMPLSLVSLRAEVPGMLLNSRVPGLNGHAPPQLPTTNCDVEIPEGESVMKKVGQVLTQGLAEGTTYLAKHGAQYWNNWRGKPSPNFSPNGATQPQLPPHQFPPTHGTNTQVPTVSKDPGLISVIDLEYLAQYSSSSGASPHPLATFKVPHGCSFISFAPSGMALLTASSKGDVQFVWDLMRIQYAKSSYLKGGPQSPEIRGPHVRQIASFSRMTIARIVDVVWTLPHGERAAMVTEPGTVHILDLPASAFAWPPPRRRQLVNKIENDLAGTALSAAGVASNAVNSLWIAARPLVGRTRRSSTGLSAMTAASVTSQAGYGTQALAAGISRSVGAATGRMMEIRMSGANKLHLPRNAGVPNRACIRLANSKHSDLVLVLGGGVVGFYTVKARKADRPADKQKASRGAKYVEFRLPSLPDFKLAREITRDLELTERDLKIPRSRSRQSCGQTPRPRGTESSIPQAEIESNAPYQPFHTDRRVELHIYSQDVDRMVSPSVSALLSPQTFVQTTDRVARLPDRWAFGGSLKTTKLDVGPSHNTTEDSFYVPSNHRALPTSAIERVMRVTDSNEDAEQILVTTRIRKSARSGSDLGLGADEEGFFEDDCEVLDFADQRV